MFKRLLATLHLLGWLVLAISSAPTWSQTFPVKPIRIVLPVGAGSGLDARAREVAHKMAERFAQPVTVENRPGAGGIIAINLVAKAPADGYTLAISGIAPIAYYPALYRKLPYAADDLVPVSLLATGPSAVYVSADSPARTLAELITMAKVGSLSFASQGFGTFQHLSGEWFKTAAGVDLMHVPYKEYAQILTDLGSGRVTILFDSTGAVLPHVRANKLRALAVTGAERLASLPHVPTFSELGLSGYDPGINYGVFAPAGTPRAVVDVLAEGFANVQRTSEIREILGRFGFASIGSGPGEFAQYISRERERWSAVVKGTGLQLDY